MNRCKNCGAETSNPKFCSRSCSASFNNRGIKRHGKNGRICPKCKGKKCLESNLCHTCYIEEIYTKRLQEPIKNFFTSNHLHPRFKHNRVRIWAKKLMVYWNIDKKCKICGYNKHVNACHIKSISKFKENTPMGMVNSKENLIYLCPNHHWELDNNILTLSSSQG